LLSFFKINNEKKSFSHLETGSVEGDVGDPLDGAVVQDVRYQEQSSYLFYDRGLKQSVV
jgi:hypothetical protein